MVEEMDIYAKWGVLASRIISIKDEIECPDFNPWRFAKRIEEILCLDEERLTAALTYDSSLTTVMTQDSKGERIK